MASNSGVYSVACFAHLILPMGRGRSRVRLGVKVRDALYNYLLLNSALPTHPFLSFGNFSDKKSGNARTLPRRTHEDKLVNVRRIHIRRIWYTPLAYCFGPTWVSLQIDRMNLSPPGSTRTPLPMQVPILPAYKDRCRTRVMVSERIPVHEES
jgi:hypothetical protein